MDIYKINRNMIGPLTIDKSSGSYVDARAYGTLGTQAAIEAAITDIGSDERTLYLAPGTWSISTSASIPANVNLAVDKGAILAIATAQTLTINGTLDAGPYQIFSCTGTGAVTFGPGAVKEAFCEWWATNTTPGASDMTLAIQAAVRAFPKVRFLANIYAITAPIYLDSAVRDMTYEILGSGKATVLAPVGLVGVPTGLADPYMFVLNRTAAGDEAYVAGWPRGPRCIIRDLRVNGTGSTAASLMYSHRAVFKLINIDVDNLKYGVNSQGYMDNCRFESINWVSPKAGGWLYTNPLAGDGFIMRNISAGDENVLKLVNCQGAVIDSCIGGHYEFNNCSSVSIRGGHFESSSNNYSFIIKNSSLSMRDSLLRADGSKQPIYINDDATVARNSNILLENLIFERNIADSSQIGTPIYINNMLETSELRVINCRTMAYIVDVSDNDPFLKQEFGYRPGSAVGDISTLFGLWYYNLYKDWQLKFNGTAWKLSIPPGVNEMDIYNLPNPTIDSAVEVSVAGCPGTLPAAPTTYYYKACLMGDGSRKSAGSSEVPIAKGTAGTLIKLTISATPGTVLQIHRTTTSGSYTGGDAQYARIPISTGKVVLYDVGNVSGVGGAISGWAWEAGVAVPSTNNTYNGKYNMLTGNRVCWIDGYPTLASWLVGDIIWNTAPTTGSASDGLGWICTTAGAAPATAKFAPIAIGTAVP